MRNEDGRECLESKSAGNKCFLAPPQSCSSPSTRYVVAASGIRAGAFKTGTTQMRFAGELAGNRFESSDALLATSGWAVSSAADCARNPRYFERASPRLA